MGKLFSALKMKLFLLLALSVIAGCGTGGLSDAPASGTTPTPTPGPAPTVETVVSGIVVDGFISGATVQAYQINANGTKGTQIGSPTTSGASGAYSLNLGSYTGPVLIESSGGSFTDWTTGATVNLAAADTLKAVVSNATATVTAQITPLTNMAAVRAQQDIAVNGTTAATAIDNANTKISQYFGAFNILTDSPIDPTVAGSATGVSQARVDYAMALAGISKNAGANAWTPFSLVTAMALDASDGTFDGKQGTTQVTVTTNAGGLANLPTTAGKSDMGAAITAFQGSAQNNSGGTATPLIITTLNATTGTYSAKPDPPTGLTATVVSSTQINLSWTASAGAAGYKIYRNGTLLKAVSTTMAADAGLTPNTQYVYAVTATDINGNESNLSSQVSATTDMAAPPVPTSLTVTTASRSQVDLAWSAGAGAAPAGYKIYKAGALLKSVTTTTSTDTGLAASTQYCYAVSSYDSTGNESARTTQVCATTQPPPPPIPPPVPTGLAATVASQSQVDLSWTASSGAVSYKISRGGVDLNTTLTTAYSDTGLTASTPYCYAVSAVDSSGNASAQSSQLCVTTLAVPPLAPTGLAAVAASTSQINLNWTSSAGAAGYKVYRSGTFVKSVTTTNTSDPSLQSGKQYCYQVTAYDATGSESTQSLQSCAATTALPTPDNFAIAAASHSQINLSWTASTGASGYKIYRGGSFLKSVGGTTASDTGLTASTQYCYTVSAYDSAGNESIPASQLCAATLSPPPPTPASFTASAVSTSQVNMSWTASTGAVSYNIYRDGTFLKNVTTSPATDAGLTANTKYCFSVSALDSTGSESAQSSQSCATTPAIEAPTNLAAVSASQSQINLTWTAPGGGAAGYNIYKKSGGSTTLLKSVTTTSTSDTGLAANTQYCYIATAYDGSGRESVQTAQVCVTTSLAAPETPTGLMVTASSQTQIDLAWTASAGATGYRIYRDGTLLKASTLTSASDTGLTASTPHCYAVSAFDVAGNESAKTGTLCATTPSPPAPATIDLLVGNPQLNSDGATTVALTALVKDAGNRAISGQVISFAADSGLLIVTNGTSDAAGAATATLGTGADPTNRTITLTATTSGTAGPISATNTVNVVGTTLAISGLNALSMGGQTELTIFLKNSAGIGIPRKIITVTSDNGNTLSAPPHETDANGQVKVTVTAAVAGDDTIRASFTGTTKTFALSVNPLVLSMTAPASGAEVAIGTNQPVAVTLKNAGVPVAGATINFMTTRGVLSSATAVTAGDGTATVNVSSTTTGPALLSAFVTGGASAQTAIEFVATTPVKMKLQANPVIIGANSGTATTEKSLITAVVRDANNNLVKNKTINFSITSDASGGTLSPASATTDSSGTATTYYIAGPASTGTDGVRISAVVEGSPAVTATIQLTVSQKALFVTLATGPKIIDLPDGQLYQKNYLALVTNATGKPIPGVKITATLTPQFYRKGFYVLSEKGTEWLWVPTLVAASSTRPDVLACANEDGILHNPLYDFNGLLDPGEDQNNNNRLDPGNIAAVTATDTDSNGFSTVSITYAKNYAYWVNVRLMVKADTEGDTTSAGVDFNLTGAAADFSDVTVSPPGYISPFGVSTSCFDTKPDAPTGITASAASSTQINLSWTASPGATGYKIYRDGLPVNSVATVTVADTGLTAGTRYCYTLSAYDSTGSESVQSAQVCVTTPSLAPPTNPTITAVSSSQINVSWTASTDAVGYRVYRDGATTAWRSVTVPTVSVTDNGLAASTQHCYRIAAYDATGVESAQTVQLCATTPTPAAVTNLTVTAASSSRIDLTWTVASGAVAYRIYRNGTPLKDVSQTSTSDTGLPANSYYCYTVSVLDGANNESAQSSQLCAATYGPPPAVPSALTVSATSPTNVDLSWTASTGASQYKIYRDGALLTATTATTYSDATAVANTQYTYTVTAIDATGSESGPTGQTIAHTGLTVPSGVTATVNSSTQITLSWTNSGGALVTGYKIYKNGLPLGAVTATSIVDGGLLPNTQYCYSVSATGNAGGESALSATVCGMTQPPPVPASMDLLVSSQQLNSDGASIVTLTAVVKDTGNRALSGQAVSFTADSGLLTVTSGTTGANGTATATLGTGGDRTNRTINLTASTAGINAPNTVTVTGTTLSISGSSSLSFGDSTPLTIFLKDSAGNGIAEKIITVTSVNGNTLSAGPYKTDANGQVIVTVTAAVGGADKIRAAAIGATKEFDLTVNANILKFTSPAPPPAAVTELAIDAWQPVSVKYTIGPNPAVGVTINFVTTRGTLSAPSAVTDGTGVATVNVKATSSGPVLFLASIDSGPSAQVAAEFVATGVNSITLQAAPNTIGTNSGGLTTEKSLITAVVRDTNNNLVKGKTVNFNIVNDASGGSLSPASSITDGSGTASTYFIAGGAPSALNGVTVRGAVAGTAPVVRGETTLTVAKKSLFITLATGPYLQAMPDSIRYQKDYVALVTDAAGDPVVGATIVATVTPVYYQKGYFIYQVGTSIRWQQVVTLQAASTTLPSVPACANEDGITHDPLKDFNGILDTGEDQNGNSRLDPGNVASVTATTTDATGHSTISIVYAKDYAYWVNVKLEVFASTVGSTASAFVTFDLPGLAQEYGNAGTSPPGNPSPFGISTSCFVDLTVTPISDSQMAITWQKFATADSYNVYRDGVLHKNVTTNTTTDDTLTAATQYCYQIKTVTSGVEAAIFFTDLACATTEAVMPPTPTDLTATGGELTPAPDRTFKVDLAWNASAGAVVYKLYRSGGAGPVTLSVAAPVVSLSDRSTSLETLTAYCYAISVLDSAGNESARSTQVCTATP